MRLAGVLFLGLLCLNAVMADEVVDEKDETPGRPRASSRSEERKTVSFDKAAKALNVTLPDGGSYGHASQSEPNSYKAALIMSRLQEQLGKE